MGILSTSPIIRPTQGFAANANQMPVMQEVGLFIPPAEDGSNVAANILAAKLAEETPEIGLVIFLTAQKNQDINNRVDASKWLSKRKFYHSTLLSDIVFPFQRANRASNPDGIMLAPDLLAEKYPGRVRIVEVPDLNSESFIAEHITGNLKLQMAFSLRNLMLFKQPMIDAFAKKGDHRLINFHPANLSRSKSGKIIRGLEGPFWSIVEGLDKLTVSMHDIDIGIDTGDVHERIQRAINGYGRGEKGISAFTRDVAPEIADKMLAYINDVLVQGAAKNPYPQDRSMIVLSRTLPTDAELESLFKEKNSKHVIGHEHVAWLLKEYTDSTLVPDHHSRMMQHISRATTHFDDGKYIKPDHSVFIQEAQEIYNNFHGNHRLNVA